MGGVGGLFDGGQLRVLLALEHAGVVASLQIHFRCLIQPRTASDPPQEGGGLGGLVHYSHSLGNLLSSNIRREGC